MNIFGPLPTAVIKNPAGSFSVVGSVPATCLKVQTPPTPQQVMAGRVFERDGVTYGWGGRSFGTEAEAAEAIRAAGVTRWQAADGSWSEESR